MKRVGLYLVLAGMCTSISPAAFDHTISDTFEGGLFTLDDESLLVTGSGAEQIWSKGSSYVEVQNTLPLQINIGGIHTLDLDDNSTMNFFDGEMGSFHIYENARAVFKGGRIDYISSHQDAIIGEINYVPIYDKHITIYCQPGWYYNGTTKVLSGLWANDDSFTIQLLNQTGYDSVWANIQIIEIPEPASLLLLGLGGLLMRRR